MRTPILPKNLRFWGTRSFSHICIEGLTPVVRQLLHDWRVKVGRVDAAYLAASADFVEKVGLRTRIGLPSASGVAGWFGRSPVAPLCGVYLAAQIMPQLREFSEVLGPMETVTRNRRCASLV